MSDRHFYAGMSRRRLIQGAATMGLLAGFDSLLPAYARGQLDNTNAFHTVRNGADIYDLTVARTPLKIGGTVSEQPITINGTLPAPLVRLKQGREAILRVTNTLPEATSIHWHGLILPYQMDGVPGVSFPGIMPGETFEYRFPVEQHGTYWYHSHSGLQEQLGHYGPIIIDPAEPESVAYDREYVVVLSDWTFDSPEDVFRNLKVAEGYYNYNQRTVSDFFKDVETMGWDAAWSYLWSRDNRFVSLISDAAQAPGTAAANALGGLPEFAGKPQFEGQALADKFWEMHETRQVPSEVMMP